MVSLCLYNVVYGRGKFSIDRKVIGAQIDEYLYYIIKILSFDIIVVEKDTKRNRSISSAW